MFCCIYYRQVVLHFKPWDTIYAVIWIGYETHGYLLQFYLHMTLTSSDTVWIMFKKGFVLYLPKSWIDTNRNSHASPSQSIRCGPSTLFSFEWKWQWIFGYEWICKMEMIMPRMTSCSIFDSNPILFDCCPSYGYQCCWILTV